MNSKEIRAKAREDLTGKWEKGICFVLAYAVISFCIGFILSFFEDFPFLNFILSIANFLISTPLAFGFVAQFIKLKRGENVHAFDFFTLGFSNFKQVWFVALRIFLKLLPVIAILVIAFIILSISTFSTVYFGYYNYSPDSSYSFGAISILCTIVIIGCYIYLIPKSLLYVLSYMVLFDNPNLNGKQIVEESARLMQSHRGSYVWLNLTFLGWAILATIPFGLGFLVLIPYIQVSSIVFYEGLKENI